MRSYQANRPKPKRQAGLDHRQTPFAKPQFVDTQYPHSLNFYTTPPTADITIEQFEQWAIDRLRILAELEACSFRNKTTAETATHMEPLLQKYLPLESNTAVNSSDRTLQRQKDHYSHFILRLAFCSTEDLRRRFSRVETMLFRLRYTLTNTDERASFVRSLDLDWEPVTESEKRDLASQLAPTLGPGKKPHDAQAEYWCKVDWERVPDLVQDRKVLIRAGKAFVPASELQSMVVTEFAARLDRALELTSRGLPNISDDDRLTPILDHLSKNFVAPDSGFATTAGTAVDGAEMTARNIDNLAQHFPLCMGNLHRTLRRDAHLKHYGRLQYTLFLKGIGLSLEECLIFWRTGFRNITDDTFNKEYRYNVRHVYGDVGGDSNRRGGGYSPFSCQRILTERAPGPGEAHGCPYRHFTMENLTSLLQSTGINDRAVLQGVAEDKESQKFHLACNRVFEHVHKQELRRARDEGFMTAAQLETIVHPNEYFKRSYLLKNMGGKTTTKKEEDVKMEE